MAELSKLPNIGKVLEQQLLDIGIITFDDLKEIGSKKAWFKIKFIDQSACMNRLLALEGAIRGIKKTELSESTKQDLKAFYVAHK